MSSKKKNNTSKLSGQALKEFRKAVATLKKQGLVSRRVDARSQKPTRYMLAKIKKLSDVLDGKMIPVKLSKEVLKKAREEHQKIYNQRVLVPRALPEAKKAAKRGEFYEKVTVTTNRRGTKITTRIVDLSRFMDMRQFLNTYMDHPHDLDKLKPKDLAWAFTYFGNKTRVVFEDSEAMINRLMAYTQMSGFWGDLSDPYSDPFADPHLPEELSNSELWEGFELYSVESNGTWEKEAAEERKAKRKKRYEKYMKGARKRDPDYAEYRRAQKAAYERDRIASMREENSEEYARIKARALENYHKRKGKKK